MSKTDTVKREAIRSAATQRREAFIKSSDKPARATPQVDNIPDELKSLARWVCWRWHRKDGRWTKKPLRPNGLGASFTNPDNWSSFSKSLEGFESNDAIDGIGLVLGDGYFGFDIDGCLDGEAIDPIVDEFIALNSSYCEVSPTKTGLKTIFRGEAPKSWNDKEIQLETNKYFTITGDLFDEYASDIAEFQSFAGTETNLDRAIEAMRRVPVNDGNDGSKRLVKYANRCVRYGLDDPEAVEAIETMLSERPTPRAYSSEEIEKRVADARKKLEAANKFKGSEGRGKPNLVSFDSIPPKLIKWLWKNRIAAGRITTLIGRPGVGKSYFTCDMSARISTGTAWPDLTPCDLGSVILITAEDDPSDTIRPRLDACGANCSRVHLLKGSIVEDKELLFTLADIITLENAIEQTRDCKLVIIDPIGSFIGGSIDTDKDNQVRDVLGPLASLAERTGVAVLIVMHTRKATSQFADDMALGSRAFIGIARTAWHLMEKDGKKLFLPGKNNLAPPLGGLSFKIEGEPARIAWDSDPVDMSADEGYEREVSRPSKLSSAMEWIKERLAQGEVEAIAMKEEGQSLGFSPRTIERAAGELSTLRLLERFKPVGPRGKWWWKLSSP